jgi:predicted nucleic acid-binding protein
VANAEHVYVDASALRRLYVHDDKSKAFCSFCARQRGSLPLTRHGRAEIVNSIYLAVFRRDIDRLAGDGAVADLDADLASGRLNLVDVPWRHTLDRAAELSVTHSASFGTRTLDVLHVASALALQCKTFVTYDDRQSRLAKAVGLKVLEP